MTATDRLKERLETVARERWEDRWTIQAQYFADSSTRMHAYSNRGHTTDNGQIRERIMPGSNGELHLERVVIEGGEEIVKRETLESPITPQ